MSFFSTFFMISILTEIPSRIGYAFSALYDSALNRDEPYENVLSDWKQIIRYVYEPRRRKILHGIKRGVIEDRILNDLSDSRNMIIDAVAETIDTCISEANKHGGQMTRGDISDRVRVSLENLRDNKTRRGTMLYSYITRCLKYNLNYKD